MDNFMWPLCALLLPLPWLVRTVSRYFTPKVGTKTDALVVPFFDRIMALSHSSFSPTNPLHFMLLSLAWICFIFSAMRPVAYITKIPQFHEARNIMLAIDFSRSMAAQDFMMSGSAVSRLDVVKAVVRDFINKRKGDNIGLIVFGDRAYTLAPLSQDMKTLNELFTDVDLGIAGEGTAIGDALALAVQDTASVPTGKKVIIILSDGQNQGGTIPIPQAIELANKQQVSIYTVGIGAKAPSKSLFSFGNHTDYTWNEAALLAIAQKTNGKYFRANSTDDLKNIYRQIDTLETTHEKGPNTKPRRELFYIPLLLGLLFWILAEQARKKA